MRPKRSSVPVTSAGAASGSLRSRGVSSTSTVCAHALELRDEPVLRVGEREVVTAGREHAGERGPDEEAAVGEERDPAG